MTEQEIADLEAGGTETILVVAGLEKIVPPLVQVVLVLMVMSSLTRIRVDGYRCC